MNAISAMPPPRDVLVLLRLPNGMEVPGMRTGDAGRMAYEYPHPPGGIADFRPTHWKKLTKESQDMSEGQLNYLREHGLEGLDTFFVVWKDCTGAAAPQKVRISSNGNLVDCGTNLAPPGMCMFGRVGKEDEWPAAYPTEGRCWDAINKKHGECDHDWNAVSHEESICRKCGFTQFTPDT